LPVRILAGEMDTRPKDKIEFHVTHLLWPQPSAQIPRGYEGGLDFARRTARALIAALVGTMNCCDVRQDGRLRGGSQRRACSRHPR
jgi:hypothetical protein